MPGMQNRRLGSSELMVSPIGLGCWQFSGSLMRAYWNAPEQKEIDAIVKTSLEGGINWFDTAEIYGFGRSEHALSLALRAAGKKDGDVVIATKWNPILRRAASIGGTFPTREKHLAPFSIDLFQVHLPYSVSSVEAQMNAMADLMDAGKIKTVGVSNFSESRMRAAQKALKNRGYALASNQMRYNLLDRSIEKNGVLDAAKELNISIIAYSPLAQGLLGGKYHSDPDALKKVPAMRRRHFQNAIERSRPVVEALVEIGKGYGASAAEVALNWLVSYHGDTVLAIPGATRLEQAKQNCRSMGFVLTQAEKERINRLSAAFNQAGG
jgi:aryl-alcohol dehydrogenase-like predicted oxidoreductase